MWCPRPGKLLPTSIYKRNQSVLLEAHPPQPIPFFCLALLLRPMSMTNIHSKLENGSATSTKKRRNYFVYILKLFKHFTFVNSFVLLTLNEIISRVNSSFRASVVTRPCERNSVVVSLSAKHGGLVVYIIVLPVWLNM